MYNNMYLTFFHENPCVCVLTQVVDHSCDVPEAPEGVAVGGGVHGANTCHAALLFSQAHHHSDGGRLVMVMVGGCWESTKQHGDWGSLELKSTCWILARWNQGITTTKLILYHFTEIFWNGLKNILVGIGTRYNVSRRTY